MVLHQQRKLSIADLRDSTRFAPPEYVDHLYRVMLQREPDPNGLQAFSRRKDAQNFFSEFLNSQEFKRVSRNTGYFSANPNDRKRILLFGAYGNGNLGDSIQAISILRSIQSIRQDLEVWACSLLPCQFPFPFEYVLPAKQIYNAPLLNQFDLIIIGGGGLLSHPHDPLTNEEWQRSIEVPVAVFGIGASAEVTSKSRTLVSRAVYVSGRDESSLMALKQFRDDVRFVPDPVLVDSHYLKAEDSPPTASGIRLWIIKNTTDNFLHGLRKLIDQKRDRICFLEPFLDFPLLNIFPTAFPIYFVTDLVRSIDQSEIVISMRYHGCILGLLRNRPVVGLSGQKCKELLKRYDHEFSCPNEVPVPMSVGFQTHSGKLTADREIFRTELSTVLSLISACN